MLAPEWTIRREDSESRTYVGLADVWWNGWGMLVKELRLLFLSSL